MEKPADRTEQARPAGVACRSYLDQLTSIRFTYEHERWALTMASTVVRWRWSCVRALVYPECVQVLGMPKAKCAAGRGHRPTSTALDRQQAGRLDVAHSHATKRISCNTPSKNPTNPDTACNMHLLHSHYLSPNSSHPAHYSPLLPLKPTFTIQAAVHPRKESILNPIGLILLIDR